MKIQVPGALLSLGLLAAAFSPTVKATIINGELNITGGIRVTANTIDFLPSGTGTGLFGIDQFSQTGSFASVAGTNGVIRDLNVLVQPVGTPFLLPNFLTFNAAPGLRFDLTFIQPGTFSSAECAAAPAAGQECTPFSTSPFNLNNVSATSSGAQFNVRGTVTDGSADPASNFVGTFSTQFPVQNVQQVLAQLGSAGFIEKSFAATFVVTPGSAIPEPGTISFLLAGSVMLIAGGLVRRKLKA